MQPQSREIRLLRAQRFLDKKFFEKSSLKIWWFKKLVLSLHRFSALKTDTAQRFLDKKFFEKKVFKLFGGSKNLPYLCIRFRLLSGDSDKRFWEKFFEKSSSKIWWFEKFALPLQPLSHFKKWLSNKRLVL